MERIDYEKHVVQDLINFRKLEELNLNPWYQRRSVWTKSQQAYLINTLVERKPVPTVYVRHSIDLEKEKSIKEIAFLILKMASLLSATRNTRSVLNLAN
jgi:hypothetical protein